MTLVEGERGFSSMNIVCIRASLSVDLILFMDNKFIGQRVSRLKCKSICQTMVDYRYKASAKINESILGEEHQLYGIWVFYFYL